MTLLTINFFTVNSINDILIVISKKDTHFYDAIIHCL